MTRRRRRTRFRNAPQSAGRAVRARLLRYVSGKNENLQRCAAPTDRSVRIVSNNNGPKSSRVRRSRGFRAERSSFRSATSRGGPGERESRRGIFRRSQVTGHRVDPYPAISAGNAFGPNLRALPRAT